MQKKGLIGRRKLGIGLKGGGDSGVGSYVLHRTAGVLLVHTRELCGRVSCLEQIGTVGIWRFARGETCLRWHRGEEGQGRVISRGSKEGGAFWLVSRPRVSLCTGWTTPPLQHA